MQNLPTYLCLAFLAALVTIVIVGCRWAISGMTKTISANAQAVVDLAAAEGSAAPAYTEALRSGILTLAAYAVVGTCVSLCLVSITAGVVMCLR